MKININVETIEEGLQERYDIMKDFDNKADEIYFKGMAHMLSMIGYYYYVKDGKVIIDRM